jgi:PhnB protein
MTMPTRRKIGGPWGSGFQGFSLSLTVPNDAEADRLFAALAEGRKVQMALTQTFFSSRFGVSWMIVVDA